MTQVRLSLLAAVLLLVSAWAAIAPPALSAGDVESSRSEVYDQLDAMGVELGPTVGRAEFDDALGLLAVATQMDAVLADAGVVVGPGDYDAFNAANGLPADFDSDELAPLVKLSYDVSVEITTLSVATGQDRDDLVAQLFVDSETDPRFGTFGPGGVEPPLAPGVPAAPPLLSS